MHDLSARLRYGVKFPVETWDEDAEPGNESKIIDTTLYSINADGYCKCLDDSENDLKEYFISILSNPELMWRFYS